jgi:hypothetical protein
MPTHKFSYIHKTHKINASLILDFPKIRFVYRRACKLLTLQNLRAYLRATIG